MTFQERATEAIYTSGGRMTGQRSLLIDLLAIASEDVDADSLHQQATQQDPNISLTTVYRTLHMLEAAGVMSSRYISSAHDRKVYSIARQQDVYHFTCRECGTVIPFQSDMLDNLSTELAEQLGVAVITLCTCVSGLCAACQSKAEKTTI